jgi:hypothetical protein
VELVTDLVRPGGIDVPYSGDLLTYRARLAEPRTRIEVESGAQGLVILVTPTAGRLAEVFADRLELPVSSVELLGEDRDGKPGSMVGTAPLSYQVWNAQIVIAKTRPRLRMAPPVGEPQFAQRSTRPCAARRDRHAGWGDLREERCLTLYQRVRHSWRWWPSPKVWLLSTSWAAPDDEGWG